MSIAANGAVDSTRGGEVAAVSAAQPVPTSTNSATLSHLAEHRRDVRHCQRRTKMAHNHRLKMEQVVGGQPSLAMVS